ncbi:DUF4241 domain-containing protein [Promicromonospora citrea]|uniref:DUF4241 domain-containing protein n=1 Tax=Promicromonospora citrea TaxID=43677 RepID=A0A8H9GGD2_9MICO|nr:DUF4241 domain-containing protein [Promicromonospora citrea]NNH53310.1 DUF4241 domain-containing protein [Promicromonospora citrea]GGM23539.1 hypothetical protein GCM10010102_19080 [Promicromonospora citrea]
MTSGTPGAAYGRPFFALLDGTPDGTPYPQTVHDAGTLHVPSGRLEASDPFVSLGDGLVVSVPPGSWPAYVTVADVSAARDGSHLREAYLSLVVADGAPVAEVRGVTPEGCEPPRPDEHYGVGVDAGTVGFADAAAAAAVADATEDEDLDEEWFDRMDDPEHLREGVANIVLPQATAGENVVLSHSGWGDGFYPVVTTHAADGSLLGVHVDLLVAGPDGDEEEDD